MGWPVGGGHPEAERPPRATSRRYARLNFPIVDTSGMSPQAIYDKAIENSIKNVLMVAVQGAIAFWLSTRVWWLALTIFLWMVLVELAELPRLGMLTLGAATVAQDYSDSRDKWFIRLSVGVQVAESTITITVLVWLSLRLF